MPYKDPNQQREYQKSYYEANKWRWQGYRDRKPRKTDIKQRPMMGLTTFPDGLRAYRRMWYRENIERERMRSKLQRCLGPKRKIEREVK